MTNTPSANRSYPVMGAGLTLIIWELANWYQNGLYFWERYLPISKIVPRSEITPHSMGVSWQYYRLIDLFMKGEPIMEDPNRPLYEVAPK